MTEATPSKGIGLHVDRCKTRGLPVDRGWSWMIVLGTMGQVLMIQTMFRATSILFVEFMETYDASTGTTSFIPSLQIFFQFLLSPITNALSLKFGARPIVVVGGLSMTIGCVASAFATSVWQLYISFGVVIGFGCSCMFAPSFVLVGQYFNKRRALANGLAGIGAAIGMFTAPITLRYILDEYGLQGSLVILGAIELHTIVFASLFRPPSFYARARRVDYESSSSESGNHSILNSTEEDKNIDEVVPSSDWPDSGSRRRSNTMPTISYVGVKTDHHTPLNDVNVNAFENKNLLQVKNECVPSLLSKSHESGLSRLRFLKRGTHILPDDSRVDENAYASFASSLGMSTGDLFSAALQNYQTEPGTSHEDMEDIENTACCSDIFVVRKKDPLTGKLNKGTALFQWNLFKNPIFVLYLVTELFGIITVPLAPTFMAAYSDQVGLPKEQIALILSISGLPEFFIRILLGIVVDCKFCSVLYVKLGVLIGLTIECFAWSFCRNFGTILTVALLATGLNGCHFTLIPVCATELMGIHALSTTMGFSMLGQSVGYGFAPLVSGYVRDLSGGWFWPFAVGGIAGLISTSLVVSTIFVQKRKQNKQDVMLEENISSP